MVFKVYPISWPEKINIDNTRKKYGFSISGSLTSLPALGFSLGGLLFSHLIAREVDCNQPQYNVLPDSESFFLISLVSVN